MSSEPEGRPTARRYTDFTIFTSDSRTAPECPAKLTENYVSRYEVVGREDFSDATCLLENRPPLMARAARPGRFVIVMANAHGERIRLTIADHDREEGTINLVIRAVDESTREMQRICTVGSCLYGIIGPMVMPSPSGQVRKVLCAGRDLPPGPVPEAAGCRPPWNRDSLTPPVEPLSRRQAPMLDHSEQLVHSAEDSQTVPVHVAVQHSGHTARPDG